MNTPKQQRGLGIRALAGLVGCVMLFGLARDIYVGSFDSHGEAYGRADHPVAFWFWMAFNALIGIAVLYWAAFGYRNNPID